VILYYAIGATSSYLQMSTIDGGTTWETGSLGYSSSWPTANMNYYAVATDKNGLTFQTSQSSIFVVDCTSPSLSGLTANPQCVNPGSDSVISVTVTDPDDGVSSVAIGVTPPWIQPPYVDSMSYIGSNVWTYTIHAWSGGTAGRVQYHVTAQDSHGNSASVFASSNSSDPSYLGYNPLVSCFA
jgi:hypothetical protein